ncbi:dna mismatch repair protein msh3 [Moniliophthora roreri]|nr:dna mismatch repair protein msh3 [Moniliophthora roreri]
MPHSGNQTVLSSYFSQSQNPKKTSGNKRLNHPDTTIDLTYESSDELEESFRPAKRTKTSHSTEPGSSSKSDGVADQWRYNPASPNIRTDESEESSAKRKARHEEFKKKLLLENKKASLFRTSSREDAFVETVRAPSPETSFPEFAAKRKAKRTGSGTGNTRREEVGPSGEPYTPLEKQVLQLRKDNPGTLLMVEVGYKYKFFGEDAKIGAKELGIACFPDRNFIVASVPVHRWQVHLKKLLSKGHRVGLVNQVETAALKKVSDNRSGPFERMLVRLCTAATYVDDIDSVDDIERYSSPPILCLIEDPKARKNSRVSMGMIAISPSTGDVIWDEFDDESVRLNLETRLEHLKPTEILTHSDGLTDPTKRFLTHLPGNVRLEYFDELMTYTEAFEYISSIHGRIFSGNEKAGKRLAEVSGLPRRVVVALAHIIQYLSAFDIVDALFEAEYFERFTIHSRSMLLGVNTLSNLEIFKNETDGSVRGSLLSILDHTKTKFGARLLKRWIGQPLTDRKALQERVDAVEEIIASDSEKLLALRQVLASRLPDLAKGLSRIHYGQCTPQELAVILPAFNKIATALDEISDPSEAGFRSPLLNNIIYALPKLRTPMKNLLDTIKLSSASEGLKEDLWKDPQKYPSVEDAHDLLCVTEAELMDELKSIRKSLKLPKLEWTTVGTEEYLVEIKNTDKRPIPPAWPLISKTKYNTRYRPPEVKQKMDMRAQCQETLGTECNKAFQSFLREIAEKYYSVMRNAINQLALADCFCSLAQVAQKADYVRPTFTDDNELEIIDGRHPMVEVLRTDPFVPNTVRMESGGAIIVTGPNMGGKSSLVRMVALISIMAQIGSYVPATSVKLGVVDAILTRMGAWDELMRGRSTFMVEMSETSEILKSATSRSLVILDELGRGTSTFDGMAVASATLHHLLQVTKCKTLFITHYPLLALEIEKAFPSLVQNQHMGYAADSRIDGRRNIIFLYQLTSGIATESFGIECARLAQVPEEILTVASQRAARMQKEIEGRMSLSRTRLAIQSIRRCLGGEDTALKDLEALTDFRSYSNQGF